MKNLKKVLALVLSMALLISTFTVSFAAEATNLDKAEKLYEMKLFNGTSGTEFVPELDGATNRIQGLVIIGRMLGWDLADIKADKDAYYFTDVPAGGFADYAQYAYEIGFTKGVGDKKFGPDQSVDSRTLYAWFYNALGFNADDSNAWDDPSLLATKGLVSVEKASEIVKDAIAGGTALIRNDLVGVMFDSLTWKAKDSDTTLIEDLVAAGIVSVEAAVAADVYTVPVVDFAVESVSTDNLRQLVVTFNKEVDEKTVLDENFVVKLNGIKKSTGATLLEDKLTVVLTSTSKFVNQKDYTVDVNKVKDVDGNAITKTTQPVYVFDGSLPEVKEVTITGPKSIVIEFTEPIETKGTVKVKSGTSTVGVNSSSITEGTSKVSVDLYSALKDGNEYTFTIKSFVDYAGYGMIDNTTALTYNKNAEEITASITKATQNYAVIEFNKPVKGLKKEFFYHSFTAWTAIGVYSDAEMTTTVSTSKAYDKVYVKFADSAAEHPLQAGSTEVVIKDKVGTAKIKDNWGNEFGGATLIAEVAVDEAAPVVDSLTVKTESTLELKFDENVDFTKSNVEVLDEDGKELSGVTVSGTKKGATYTINLGKSYSGKTINVTIKNVTDLALKANKLVSYADQFTITDKTAPTVSNVTKKYVADGEQSLYVFFSEAVNDTALDINNYYLQNATNSIEALAGDVEFYDGDKTVRISLSDDEKAFVEANYKLVVRNIEDVFENILVGQVKAAIDYADNANKATVAKAEVTAKDTVVITFNQYLPTIEAAAFTIGTKAPAGMELSTDKDGNSVVTLVTASDKKFDADLNPTQVVAISGATDTLSNVFGVVATAVPNVTLTDKIAPALSIAEDDETNNVFTLDYDDDNIVDAVVLRYDEAINKNTISSLSYTLDNKLVATDAVAVSDGDLTNPETHTDAAVKAVLVELDTDAGTYVEGNGHYVVITLSAKDSDGTTRVADTDLAPEVTQALNIYDVEGNVLEASDDTVAAVDTLELLVTEVKMTTDVATADDKFGSVGDVVTVTFSENVSLNLTDTDADSDDYYVMTNAEFAAITGLTAADGALKVKVDENTLTIEVTTAITSLIAMDTAANGTATDKVQDTSKNNLAVTSGVKITE